MCALWSGFIAESRLPIKRNKSLVGSGGANMSFAVWRMFLSPPRMGKFMLGTTTDEDDGEGLEHPLHAVSRPCNSQSSG